jgi:acyl-CoA reductase-like NAD-dependent aldehyde dehydrogenase
MTGSTSATTGARLLALACLRWSRRPRRVVGRVPAATTSDIDAAVASARAAFDTDPWPRTEAADRAEMLTPLSKILAGRVDVVARLISTETGISITFSLRRRPSIRLASSTTTRT